MTARRMLRLATVALLLAGCVASNSTEASPMTDALTVTSSAFADGEAIPARHGCDDEDVSPALAWSDPPAGTAAIALIVDDPDARGFAHWVAADIPAEPRSLDEGASGSSAGTEGRNDFGRTGYGGPCPPSGSHRYVFTVFAVSQPVEVAAGFSADELRSAIEGNVLASGRLTGTFSR